MKHDALQDHLLASPMVPWQSDCVGHILCLPADSFLLYLVRMPLYRPALVHEQQAHVRRLASPGESNTATRMKKNAHLQRQPEKTMTGSGPSYLQMMDAVPLKTQGSETWRVRGAHQRATTQQAAKSRGRECPCSPYTHQRHPHPHPQCRGAGKSLADYMEPVWTFPLYPFEHPWGIPQGAAGGAPRGRYLAFSWQLEEDTALPLLLSRCRDSP